MQPAPKRQLRPTASVPTTAEHYGEQFGLPEHLQAALQNVGRRNRMLVSQGRQFDRTQSFPVFGSSSSFTPDTSAPMGFTTEREAMEHAQRLIAKEEARKNELKPYSNLADVPRARSHSPEGVPSGRRLVFGEDGLLLDQGMEWEGSPKKVRTASKPHLTPSKKRRASKENGEDGGSDTDIDDDDNEGGVSETPALTTAAGSTSTADEFPAVFKSPDITHPELFGQNKGFPSRLGGRAMKGMPGRQLGKTMSAPVGKMGAWGDMDVDGAEQEDGFDVSEWAASDDF